MMQVSGKQAQYLLDARNYAVGSDASSAPPCTLAVPPDVTPFYTVVVEKFRRRQRRKRPADVPGAGDPEDRHPAGIRRRTDPDRHRHQDARAGRRDGRRRLRDAIAARRRAGYEAAHARLHAD
jgi:hypothetical protein